jgi:hypothetical protein
MAFRACFVENESQLCQEAPRLQAQGGRGASDGVRRFVRRACRFYLAAWTEDGWPSVQMEALDVSSRGLWVVTERPLDPQAGYLLRFMAPLSGREARVWARVARVGPTEGADVARHRAALVFDEGDAPSFLRAELERFVQRRAA